MHGREEDEYTNSDWGWALPSDSGTTHKSDAAGRHLVILRGSRVDAETGRPYYPAAPEKAASAQVADDLANVLRDTLNGARLRISYHPDTQNLDGELIRNQLTEKGFVPREVGAPTRHNREEDLQGDRSIGKLAQAFRAHGGEWTAALQTAFDDVCGSLALEKALRTLHACCTAEGSAQIELSEWDSDDIRRRIKRLAENLEPDARNTRLTRLRELLLKPEVIAAGI